LEDIGFGIIGAGAICPLHIAAIEASQGGRLVAIADVSAERAKAIGEERGIAWYADHNELLRDPDVDVVCALTPSGMRAPVCIDAARAGKHIIAEKPLEVTLDRVDSIINECDRAGVRLAVIFQIRFLPGAHAACTAALQGRLGKLIMGDACVKWHRAQDYYDSATWRGTWEFDGGGVLMNQGIHYVDLLQWAMGPVESIFGHTDTLVRQRIEVEDTAVACLRFANGALGTIEACTSAHKGQPARLELRGEKGTVIVEDGNVILWDVPGEEDFVVEKADTGSGATNPMAISSIGHVAQIADMVNAIREDRPPIVDGREARKAIEIISGIYRSSQSGQPVRLPL
jgi:UDP-N-acetyl-2-amino-2-deoxyglucuronate dehydrogenase